jgi:ATP-dependent helicase/nuclease subunit A
MPASDLSPLDRTRRNQRDASDPRASAWVIANAGSGKTHVLTQRVIRLLLAGTDPAAILCLTFTKIAAAEMSRRVFGTLAKWAMLDQQKLAEERVRSDVLADANVRAVMDAFPDSELESFTSKGA